jgi:hypothetical protein
MLSKSMQLETELYKAIDGFVIARVEEILGCDDPGISLTAARAALQKQLRILCNEACAYQPNFIVGGMPAFPREPGFCASPGLTGPIVADSTAPFVIEDNFHMKDLFAENLGIKDF